MADHGPFASLSHRVQYARDLGKLAHLLAEFHDHSLMRCPEFIHRREKLQSAPVKHRDLVGHALDLIEQMRREDDRAPFFGHGPHDHGEDIVPRHGVQPGGRLIE